MGGNFWRSALGATGMVVMAGMLMGADAPTGGAPDTRAFVFSNLWLAAPEPQASPPPVNDGGVQIFFKSLAPEEQARYAAPDRLQALEAEMARRSGFRTLAAHEVKLPSGVTTGIGLAPEQVAQIAELNGLPKGRGRMVEVNGEFQYTSCTDPEDFPFYAEGFRTFDAPVALGMNLDGRVSREDFVGPNGEKGIDNQLWRALGLIKVFREQSNDKIARNVSMSMSAPTLVEVRNVDDWRNDPQVTVTVYAAAEPLARDSQGKVLQRVSYAVIPDARLQATTTGSIRDGVLTTEPVDLRLNYVEQIMDAPRDIRAARIRAEIKDDGTIDGALTGYYTLTSFWDHIADMTQGGANANGISCPGLWRTLNRLADGYQDPVTKKYTAISMAMKFAGARVFVAQPEQRAADGGS